MLSISAKFGMKFWQCYSSKTSIDLSIWDVAPYQLKTLDSPMNTTSDRLWWNITPSIGSHWPAERKSVYSRSCFIKSAVAWNVTSGTCLDTSYLWNLFRTCLDTGYLWNLFRTWRYGCQAEGVALANDVTVLPFQLSCWKMSCFNYCFKGKSKEKIIQLIQSEIVLLWVLFFPEQEQCRPLLECQGNSCIPLALAIEFWWQWRFQDSPLIAMD